MHIEIIFEFVSEKNHLFICTELIMKFMVIPGPVSWVGLGVCRIH